MQAQRSESASPIAVVSTQRYDGEQPPEGLRHSALRRNSVEVTTRADGSLLVRWPEEVVRLKAGPAEPGAPTDRMVDNVVDWLAVWAEVHPLKPMLSETTPDGTLTEINYARAWAHVQAIGHALLDLGKDCKRAAPVVAVLTGNSVTQALLTFAALYVGWTVVPITPAYAAGNGQSERLKQLFNAVQPDFVYAESIDEVRGALDFLEVAAHARLTRAQVGSWGAAHLDTETRDLLRAEHTSARGERVAKIMFTSGSTGVPKGVVMTHAMLAAAQSTSAANLSAPPSRPQVYLDWLPWHHVMGGNVVLNRLLRFGGTLHIDSGRPAPGKFNETLRNLRRVSPTFYFNVPLGYAMLASALEADDALAACFFRHLEYLSFGGASLSVQLVDRLKTLAIRHIGYAIPITSGYGATETSGPGLSTTWDMDSGGALGLPAPGFTAKLQPLDDRYELCLAGAGLATHYLGGAATNADAEGYVRTGDAVTWVDPARPLQGLAFAGRVSEQFKLQSGTWVHVGTLRQRVVDTLAPLVSDAVITGHDRTYVGALLFMNERALRAQFADAASLTREQLAQHPPVLAALAMRLDQLQGGSSMRVLRAMLLAEDPVAEAFEITDKGYINQRAVLQRRAAWVDALHAATPDARVLRLDAQA